MLNVKSEPIKSLPKEHNQLLIRGATITAALFFVGLLFLLFHCVYSVFLLLSSFRDWPKNSVQEWLGILLAAAGCYLFSLFAHENGHAVGSVHFLNGHNICISSRSVQFEFAKLLPTDYNMLKKAATLILGPAFQLIWTIAVLLLSDISGNALYQVAAILQAIVVICSLLFGSGKKSDIVQILICILGYR